jgi:hypothetical protein
VQNAGLPPLIPLEERWYRRNATGNRQFVADPDGYLLRFCTDFGARPLSKRWSSGLRKP